MLLICVAKYVCLHVEPYVGYACQSPKHQIEYCLQRFLSTPRNCSVKHPPIRCVSAMIAAGLGNDSAKHDYRREVMVNKFPFPGDMGNASKNAVLVFLHPPPGIKPLQYLLKPQLALVCVHVHVQATTQVHTIIRRIPEHCILPDPTMDACVVCGWKTYSSLAQDEALALDVVPAEVVYDGCVNQSKRKELQLEGVAGPILHVVPFI